MTDNNDSIREKIADLVEKHFPKGECKERGQAMVLVAEILPLISDAKKEAEKAYGGCHNCYGKGYATTIDYLTSFPDFIGDKGFKRQNDLMRFCNCNRGKQLEAIINTLKEQSSKGGENG